MISIRKVIKFGKNSLVVTIPPKWWRDHNEPNHVEVDDSNGDKLIISPVKRDTK